MCELASFAVTSEETANQALDYFNGFHDGFMSRIVIESHDRIEEDLSQICTGLFRVEIDIAHYNYAHGAEPFHPYHQIVGAEFRNVQDIVLDFGSAYLGNTIIALAVIAAGRRGLSQTAAQPCLALRLARHYYLEEHRRYDLRESQLFTFTDATFSERPGTMPAEPSSPIASRAPPATGGTEAPPPRSGLPRRPWPP